MKVLNWDRSANNLSTDTKFAEFAVSSGASGELFNTHTARHYYRRESGGHFYCDYAIRLQWLQVRGSLVNVPLPPSLVIPLPSLHFCLIANGYRRIAFSPRDGTE